jgi:hypothetical protein
MKLTGLILTAFSLSAVVLSQPATAQYQENADPLGDLNHRNVEGQSDNGLNQNTIFDLIHQAQQGSFNIDYEAVQMRQNQSIQDAAAEFREKQRQLLQQRGVEATTPDDTGSPQE